MPTLIGTTKDTDQIQELIAHWTASIRKRDADGMISCFGRDCVLFDVAGPLQYVGDRAIEKRAEEWLEQFQGELEFEVRELEIVVGYDAAFSHGLNHVKGFTVSNQEIDMWWRATVCYRKINDKWIVVHEHNSVPFDANTGKASVDLKP